MQPSTLLLVTASSLGLASAASLPNDPTLHAMSKRACFQTGASFGDQRSAAADAAKKSMQRPSQRHVQEARGHNAGSTRSIAYAECLDGLSSEIYNCGKGGDTTYGNWRYRADPNNNACA
ncbi:hypothetical protein OPT61_g8377 [Boeremia exigua]|uniref:Uncharacterized protein n=1 Tax=Boeremia exigua TaxID=749465 RepID=A0ACC2HZA9_9PLEO|nr:hypothetical protein OPT61_g8377 [Boeremia exigua]